MRISIREMSDPAKASSTPTFLLHLPDELLVTIFDYVGPQFFRSNIERLTICKQWCKFAIPVCYTDFYANQFAIEKFMAFGNVHRNQQLLQYNIRSFTLILDHDSAAAETGIWEHIDRNLSFLASLLKGSSHLCALRFKGARLLLEPQGPEWIARRLSFITVREFLSVENLSILELDMCAPNIAYGHQRSDESSTDQSQLCGVIARCLSKLSSLRLRLLTICPDILTLAPHQTNLRLVESLINLSLVYNGFPERGSPIAVPCVGYEPQPYVTVKTALQHKAQVLASQMTAPKMVRIIYHNQRHPDGLRAYDALTDSVSRIGACNHWDDEGGELVTMDSEDEEYNSDLSYEWMDPEEEYEAFFWATEEGYDDDDDDELSDEQIS